MIKVGMVSLGCSKNQVDAERMMAALQAAGMQLVPEGAACDAVIINTCGFIESAKAESIDTILEFAKLKEQGQLRAVAVTGCLAERYYSEMQENFPEVDVILGIGSNSQIAEALRQAMQGCKTFAIGEKGSLSLEGERVLANPGYYAYLKVAEGCDNRCTYCAIPLIRGRFRSRSIENIVAEAQQLAAQGVVELNLVAQDTTRYGEDLYGTLMLPELLREVCAVEGVRWVRLLYCYPERVTDELLEVMAEQPKIVRYLDLPLQHISPRILKAMNRPSDVGAIRSLLQKVRERLPGVALRTTFITGFPGETQQEFEELCEFVKEIRFDRMGCFAYSREEDTPAADYPGQIDPELAQRRAQELMELQMLIADDLAGAKIGSKCEVLCCGYDQQEQMETGRSAADAPDVDSLVFFKANRPLAPGSFCTVQINENIGYDLYGKEVPR